MAHFTRKLTVAAACTSALVSLLVVGSGAAASPPRPVRIGSPPRPVRIGSAPRRPHGARVIGTLPGSTSLTVSVTLEPRDPAALAAYAAAVSTPGSADYRRYLTVSQFAQRFGPSASTVAAVQSALRAQGLHPGAASPNRLSIPVTASAGALSQAFSTSIQRVALPSGRTAFANANAPAVAQNVASAVQGVIGLDDLAVAQPALARQAPRGAAVS